MKGTNFQLKVWRALIEAGAGAPTTYGTLARAAGSPAAARAVGAAVGANPVAWLIPCHNVLRADGASRRLPLGSGAQAGDARLAGTGPAGTAPTASRAGASRQAT